jgi:hypothetical protein
MPSSPRYRGLRLDGPLEAFHRAVDRLWWDTVPTTLDHHLPAGPPPRRRRRREPSDGQAALVEEAP